MALPRQNRAVPVDRLAQLNDPADAFKNPVTLSFMRVLVDIIRRTVSEVVYRDTPTPHVFMEAPNGTIWKVTITDAGVLETNQIG